MIYWELGDRLAAQANVSSGTPGKAPSFAVLPPPTPLIHLPQREFEEETFCPLWPLVRSKCGWDVAYGPTAIPTLNFRAFGSPQSSSFLEATKTF